MTEDQKKIAIVGIVLLIILFLLMKRRGPSQTLVEETTGGYGPIGDISIPSLELPIRSDYEPFVLPPLGAGNPYSGMLDMLSACACGGSSVPFYTRAEAEAMPHPPTIYYPPTPPKQPSSGMFVASYSAPSASSWPTGYTYGSPTVQYWKG